MITAQKLAALGDRAKQLADVILNDESDVQDSESCARILAQIEFIATRYSEREAHKAHAEAMAAAAAASRAKRVYYELSTKLAEQPSYFGIETSYTTGGDVQHNEED